MTNELILRMCAPDSPRVSLARVRCSQCEVAHTGSGFFLRWQLALASPHISARLPKVLTGPLGAPGSTSPEPFYYVGRQRRLRIPARRRLCNSLIIGSPEYHDGEALPAALRRVGHHALLKILLRLVLLAMPDNTSVQF
jgi:hypothetical protein